MKNVLLISQSATDFTNQELKMIIRKIVADGSYQIIMALLQPRADKASYLAIPGVCQVMDSLEIEYEESMEGLDFETIESCRDLQLNIEAAFYRQNADYQIDKYAYYAILSFWNSFGSIIFSVG